MKIKEMYPRALEIAHKAHKDQKRHRDKEDYINHPIRVASKFTDDFRKTLAILHDVGEDHPEYWPIIKKEFPLEIVHDLELLTRIEGRTYFDFIMTIGKKGNKMVITVKLADLEDNMIDLKEGSKKDKYRFAYYLLTKMFTKNV